MTSSNTTGQTEDKISELFSELSPEHTAYLRKLVEGGVPVETWGTGGRKPLEALFSQLDSGETTLKLLDGKPIRCIRVAAVNIVCAVDKLKRCRLIESRQVFTDSKGNTLKNIDGSNRVKFRKLKSSLSETIKITEEALEGAVRGIEEELGIKINPDDLVLIEEQVEFRESNSFAGLKTRYEVSRYRWEMPSKHYRSTYKDDRQIKLGERLVSHFEWIPESKEQAA